MWCTYWRRGKTERGKGPSFGHHRSTRCRHSFRSDHPPSTLTLALLLLPLLLSFRLLLVISYLLHTLSQSLFPPLHRQPPTTHDPGLDTITNTPPPIALPPRADLLIPD